jgi:hypothetical protein
MDHKCSTLVDGTGPWRTMRGFRVRPSRSPQYIRSIVAFATAACAQCGNLDPDQIPVLERPPTQGIERSDGIVVSRELQSDHAVRGAGGVVATTTALVVSFVVVRSTVVAPWARIGSSVILPTPGRGRGPRGGRRRSGWEARHVQARVRGPDRLGAQHAPQQQQHGLGVKRRRRCWRFA